MLNQDYFFAALLIICALFMVHWGIGHSWRH
jgi:hypothetical protein